MSSAYTNFQLPTGTSGHVVPYLDGDNTFSGVNSIDGNLLMDTTVRQYWGQNTGTDAYFVPNGFFKGVDLIFPDGGKYSLIQASVIGTNDIFFQALPAGSAWFVIESFGGQGIALSTNGSPVNFYPNRTYAGGVSGAGNWQFQNTQSYETLAAAGDRTMALGDASYQEYTGAGGNTWTLPSRAACRSNNAGARFIIKNIGTGALTVARAGADQIFSTSVVNDISLAIGASAVLTAGSAYWNVGD